ncbi:MAG: protein-glutamine gamma-glutamyltransferase, partial [Clostridiales bacterium]|nr:protein-glutamine gamma-glutamyltransferase [Clostridiales bacterium]
IRNADQIIRVLNANRIDGATKSAFFMENYAARPNFKRLEEAQRTSTRPAVLHWRPFPQAISG